jgi:hypothetical protein
MKIDLPCDICEKETQVRSGWHLEGDLNFCSNQCVSKYIENNMQELFKIVKRQEQRIYKIEKFLKLKGGKAGE